MTGTRNVLLIGLDPAVVDYNRWPGLAAVQRDLAELKYDCVMIGAGVRTDAQEFALFETLINVVHAHAPTAKICFNTMPSDTVAAVKRWLP